MDAGAPGTPAPVSKKLVPPRPVPAKFFSPRLVPPRQNFFHPVPYRPGKILRTPPRLVPAKFLSPRPVPPRQKFCCPAPPPCWGPDISKKFTKDFRRKKVLPNFLITPFCPGKIFLTPSTPPRLNFCYPAPPTPAKVLLPRPAPPRQMFSHPVPSRPGKFFTAPPRPVPRNCYPVPLPAGSPAPASIPTRVSGHGPDPGPEQRCFSLFPENLVFFGSLFF